ncbi:MAG: DNA-binding response regulator [Chloroflexi bacterium]|nr:MAG: DNA-binding response regulator [Chloroflexota bacterium]
MTDEQPIRVLLVDDHAVVRRGMRAYLELLDDIEIAGEAANGQEALQRIATDGPPDVVVMDLMMPVMDGIAATAAIKERWSEVEVVALTSFIEEEKVHGALQAGATGYLLKDAAAEEIATAIRAAHNGEMHLDPAVAKRLMHSLQTRTPEQPVEPLTARELDVLVLVAEGRANKQIARQLGISERTARTHVSNILGKLGLQDRTQAALYAVRHGLAHEP